MDVIKVFFSSPGDVADERGLALRTLGQLNRERYFKEKGVRFEAVAWDGPGVEVPMLATETAQLSVDQSIGKPSDCDIVVVIVWSRIGTQLPAEYRKPDGSVYRSGTEYEFLDAMAAQVKPSKPLLLVYRCKRTVSIDQDAEDKVERERQYEAVKSFFAEFTDAQTHAIHHGVNKYKEPGDFERMFGAHLRELAGRLLDGHKQRKGKALAETNQSSAAKAVGWEGSPFRGLEVYKEQHEPIFFGRTHEVDGLVARLKHPERRFLAVVGASGSGKSSLVRAGLLPRLRRGAVEGSDKWIYLPSFTPGELRAQPILNLAVGLAPYVGTEAGKLADQLEAEPGAFEAIAAKAIKSDASSSGLFVFIDQFEELFSVVSEPIQERFVGIVSAAGRTPLVRLIITVRADFYHLCVNDTFLAQLFRERDALYTLLGPDRGDLSDMIEGPARLAGVTLEPGLSERIVRDMCGKSGVPEPGSLPLLSFTLELLYNKARDESTGKLRNKARDESTERLSLKSYDILGEGIASGSGVHGAIGKQAEDAFSKLSQEGQDAFSEVFRELVHIDENNLPTRSRAPKTKCAESRGAQEFCESFSKLRLLVPGGGEGDEPVIEVAHEAILTNWPRLDDWIKTSRDDLRARRQMTQAAEEWDKQGRKEKFLWSDERVVDMAATLERLGLTVKDLSVNERDFLGPLDRGSMLKELDDANTTHERRAIIGVRLSLLPLGDTRPGVGLRFDGLPEIVWCEVPKGEVTLEKDAGTFPVEPFQISKYPITWVQYRAFLEAPDGFRESAWWEGLEFQVDKPGKQFNRYDNHPAENVCWLEAVAFCNWLTRKYRAAGLLQHDKVIRLPTEWEWQQAATGGDPNREYPWGEWQSELANTYDSELGRSTAVGMYPRGSAPEPIGALDMSGNVWEWCLNKHEKKSVKDVSLGGLDPRVVRGGSWDFVRELARASFRFRVVPLNRYYFVGFRVVSSSPIS